MDVDSNSNHPLGVGVGGGGGAGAGGAGSGDGEGGKDGKEGGKDHGQHPPAKRYRLTDTMKSIVWELVLLSNECCRLENEKKLVFDDCSYHFFYNELTCALRSFFTCCSSLEGSVIQISDQGLRKVLYQKVHLLFYSSFYSLF